MITNEAGTPTTPVVAYVAITPPTRTVNGDDALTPKIHNDPAPSVRRASVTAFTPNPQGRSRSDHGRVSRKIAPRVHAHRTYAGSRPQTTARAASPFGSRPGVPTPQACSPDHRRT